MLPKLDEYIGNTSKLPKCSLETINKQKHKLTELNLEKHPKLLESKFDEYLKRMKVFRRIFMYYKKPLRNHDFDKSCNTERVKKHLRIPKVCEMHDEGTLFTGKEIIE